MEKRGFLSIIVVLIFAGVVAYMGISWWMEKTSLSTETAELTDYYDIPADEILVFDNGIKQDDHLPYLDGIIYLKLDYVQKLNKRFYWDESLESLIFTTANEIQIIKAGEKQITVEDGFVEEGSETDGFTRDFDYIILREIDGVKYIALNFVEGHLNITADFYENPNRLLLRSEWREYLFVTVKKDTQLRTGGSIKSAVLRELPAGTKLELSDSDGTNRSGFLRAMTEDGVLAYVDSSYLEESNMELVESSFTEEEYSHIQLEETVCLAWNVVVSKAKNSEITKLLKNTADINVLSPTWFNLKNAEGDLEDRAAADYVTTAHEKGIQVWALVSNFSPVTGSMKLDEEAMLSSREIRAKIISQLMDAAKTYGFDGINVDFEDLKKAAGKHYIQFIRELSVACRHEQLVLSVDDYVPFNYNSYYDIAEQGKVADYVIIMAYDEHYDGSEAGSVASLTYVKTAIENTFAKVSSEQVVIGLPFYTRLWKVTLLTDGKYRTYSETLTMTEAEKYIKNHRWVSNWYEEEGQNYYTADEGNITYKLWNEDAESIQKKCEVIFANKTAGIACWRLGQETSDVWAVISSFLHPTEENTGVEKTTE